MRHAVRGEGIPIIDPNRDLAEAMARLLRLRGHRVVVADLREIASRIEADGRAEEAA